jgi:hypothetical protein
MRRNHPWPRGRLGNFQRQARQARQARQDFGVTASARVAAFERHWAALGFFSREEEKTGRKNGDFFFLSFRRLFHPLVAPAEPRSPASGGNAPSTATPSEPQTPIPLSRSSPLPVKNPKRPTPSPRRTNKTNLGVSASWRTWRCLPEPRRSEPFTNHALYRGAGLAHAVGDAHAVVGGACEIDAR